MNKLKDFFYDKNDILVALIILAIAALIVFWRVDAIMDYPAKLVAEAAENDTQYEPIGNHGDNSSNETTSGEAITSGGAVTSGSAIDTGSDEVDICAVYVNYGESLDIVAANCVTAGLIGSVDEFMALVEARGAGSMIQAGQHHIPSNVTPDELIDYLLQPGL